MTERPVEVDDGALEFAQVRLGMHTTRGTVSEALRRAAEERQAQLTPALDVLADTTFDDRRAAWRWSNRATCER